MTKGDHRIVPPSVLPPSGFPCSLTGRPACDCSLLSAEAYVGLSFICNEQVTSVGVMNHNRLIFRAAIQTQHNNINSVLPLLMISFHFIRQSRCFACYGAVSGSPEKQKQISTTLF